MKKIVAFLFSLTCGLALAGTTSNQTVTLQKVETPNEVLECANGVVYKSEGAAKRQMWLKVAAVCHSSEDQNKAEWILYTDQSSLGAMSPRKFNQAWLGKNCAYGKTTWTCKQRNSKVGQTYLYFDKDSFADDDNAATFSRVAK